MSSTEGGGFSAFFHIMIPAQKSPKYREIHYNIGRQKMAVNRLNPVQKATYFLKNQKWEK